MNVAVTNIWIMLQKAGPMIWPLFLLSIVATTIVIERFIFVTREEKNFIKQRILILNSLRQGNMKETLKVCEAHQGLVSTIVKTGIIKSSTSQELIKLSMQEFWLRQEILMDRHVSMLGMIVNVAPLLGLLGTVNALTVVFHASVIRSNVLNPLTAGELASGVWQALLTTTAGLMVGIFSYVAHCFYTSRMTVYSVWVEHLIAETLQILVSLKEDRSTMNQGEYEG